MICLYDDCFDPAFSVSNGEAFQGSLLLFSTLIFSLRNLQKSLYPQMSQIAQKENFMQAHAERLNALLRSGTALLSLSLLRSGL